MPPDGPGCIPGVDDREIAGVAAVLPSLPNVDAEPGDRFAQAVRHVVERRAQGGWREEDDSDDVAVFVLVAWPRVVGERYRAEPFADPIASDQSLLGRLLFSNADASNGRLMTLPTDPGAILEWLDREGIGGCPMVTVYRKKKTMVTRSTGTQGRSTEDDIRDREPEATLGELSTALTHFHEQWLITPNCCLEGVWATGMARHYIPGKAPEKAIQGRLAVALSCWFRGVLRAELEDRTNIGRIDVRLLQARNGGGLAYWAIVELKVIKSFRHASSVGAASKVGASENVRTVVEGIKQASEYRANRQADEGLLEIFDLRKDKAANPLAHWQTQTVLSKCNPAPAVNLRPVYGSARDARDARRIGV